MAKTTTETSTAGRRNRLLTVVAVVVIAGVAWRFWPGPREIDLTGTVTTDEIVVGSEILGRVSKMLVREGDAVTNGQLLAVIQPQSWQAEMDYYEHSKDQSAAQVESAVAELKREEAQ